MEAPTFDTPMEVAPGKFKPLGECDAADLKGAQAVNTEKADLSGRMAESARTMMRVMEERGLESVSVPAWLRERSEVDLPTLRRQATELETFVIANGLAA